MADKQEGNKGKPKRNPVERAIVWGVIGVALVLVATEALARFGYQTSLERIQAALQAEDEGVDSEGLTLEKAEAMMLGFPKKTTEGDVVTYRFKGLLKDFGGIHLHVGAEGKEVMGLETDAPEEEEATSVAADVSVDDVDLGDGGPPEGYSGGPGGGDRGGRGGQGGRGRFDPMQADADGDGKLSQEEFPERMRAAFDEIDTNGDGFVDAQELEARRAARQADGGRRPGGEGDRPARPEIEEDSESTTTDNPESDSDE